MSWPAGEEGKGGCLYIRQQYYTFLDTNYVPYRDDYLWPPKCTPEGRYAELQRKGPIGEEMQGFTMIMFILFTEK